MFTLRCWRVSQYWGIGPSQWHCCTCCMCYTHSAQPCAVPSLRVLSLASQGDHTEAGNSTTQAAASYSLAFRSFCWRSIKLTLVMLAVICTPLIYSNLMNKLSLSNNHCEMTTFQSSLCSTIQPFFFYWSISNNHQLQINQISIFCDWSAIDPWLIGHLIWIDRSIRLIWLIWLICLALVIAGIKIFLVS